MNDTLFEGRYRLIRQIGSGGMGVVYEAEDELLQKIVAIKTIKKGVLTADLIVRFQREANALAALNHPCLVPLFVFGITDENQPYMVMQYEPGKPLSEVIEARGYLPVHKSINIFLQLCDAIQHAHEHGVLHRDLKPGNVILRNPEKENPDVVLIDFGIAMVTSNNSMDSLTKTGLILGTPAYMSPEQVTGKELDERSDVYSLGCIMYETLTGAQPFNANSALELLTLKTTQSAPSINTAVKDLSFPIGAEEIIGKCLETDPALRYESAVAVKYDLMRLKSGEYIARSERDSTEVSQSPRLLSNSSISHSKPAGKGLIVLATVILLVCATAAVVVLSFEWNLTTDRPLRTHELAVTQMQEKRKNTSFDDTPLSFDGSFDSTESVRRKILESPGVRKITINRGKSDIGKAFKGLERTRIEEIELINTYIDDEGLKAISGMKSVKQLLLEWCNQFTSKGISYLQQLPALTILSMHNCQIDNAKVRALCRLKNLTSLGLVENKEVGDQELKLIGENLRRLNALDLDGTSVKAEGLASLEGLTLHKLSLRNTNLSRRELEAISRLRVWELDIKLNKDLKEEDLLPLMKMSSLTNVQFDSPFISDQFVGVLKRNSKLTVDTKPAASLRFAQQIDVESLGEKYTISTKDKSIISMLGDKPRFDQTRGDIAGSGSEFNLQVETDQQAVKAMVEESSIRKVAITKVRATDSDITGICFEDCKLPIESISTQNNRISDKGLLSISKLKHLKQLCLRNEVLLEGGLAHLKDAPSLERVYVIECVLNPQSLKDLASSKSLKTLYLRRCTEPGERFVLLSGQALSDIAEARPKNLRELSWLRMRPLKLELSLLKGLPNLKVLKLNCLSLENSALKELEDLGVEDLDLRNNNGIDLRGLKHLEKMKALKKVHLDPRFTMKELKKQLPNLARKVVIQAQYTQVEEDQFDRQIF